MTIVCLACHNSSIRCVTQYDPTQEVCIPRWWQCDAYPDCLNKQDEMNCRTYSTKLWYGPVKHI